MTAEQGRLFAEQPAQLERELDLYPASRIQLSSASEHWCSPEEVLDPVRSFAPIGFDPFSNVHSLVGANRSVMLPEDSLTVDWPTDCLSYSNPPYGPALADCARKMKQQARRGCEIITLVPARVDTVWWQELLAPAIWCAWTGRITFLETVESLLARHAERAEKARAAGLKPPAAPRFQRVGEHLARGETATFASALAYFGPRPGRFAQVFESLGRIYHELG